MAKASSKTEKQLSDILRHLHMQRENILNKWRSTCAENLIMLSKTSFSREEFNDQVPAILNILDQRLAKLPEESEVVIVAQEHWLHRWQRGYSLPELLSPCYVPGILLGSFWDDHRYLIIDFLSTPL